ncbi:hypothetical protein ABPG77_004980 [Micractinium sp. CCAP 211/92]
MSTLAAARWQPAAAAGSGSYAKLGSHDAPHGYGSVSVHDEHEEWGNGGAAGGSGRQEHDEWGSGWGGAGSGGSSGGALLSGGGGRQQKAGGGDAQWSGWDEGVASPSHTAAPGKKEEDDWGKW